MTFVNFFNGMVLRLLRNRHWIRNVWHKSDDVINPKNTSTEARRTEQQAALQQQLNRLLQPVTSNEPVNETHLNTEKRNTVITKVLIRPNAFFTAITLDVACEQSRHTIVRMYNLEGRIFKMFSWFLVRGTNITSINEINSLLEGTYYLDMIDNEGNLLYSTNVIKNS
jgi:hypothetical protein